MAARRRRLRRDEYLALARRPSERRAEQIRIMAADGVTQAEAAQRLGVSSTAVGQTAKRYGVRFRRHGAWTAAEVETLRRAAAEDWRPAAPRRPYAPWIVAAAERLGRNPAGVRDYARRHAIRRPPTTFGKKGAWRPADTRLLETLIRDGATWPELAAKLGRSLSAIEAEVRRRHGHGRLREIREALGGA